MARTIRINLPFSLYHVLSRTNTGVIAFADHEDEQKFLLYLGKYAAIFSIKIHAWCLMNTHFHILMETAEQPDISEFMRRLLTVYTVYYNRRHKRHGHLFHGRFKSYVVDKAAYLLELSRYINLNPATASSPQNPETYRGSSLRYYIHGGEPEFLYTAEILAWFKGNRKQYAKFVRKGLSENIKPEIIGQMFVGAKNFIQKTQNRKAQLEKSGTRAWAAQKKREQAQQDKQKRKAEEILNKVADYFHLSPEAIKNSRYGKGTIGKARSLVLMLLRAHLPWSGARVMRFMGLRSQSMLSYHSKAVSEEDYCILEKEINNKNKVCKSK